MCKKGLPSTQSMCLCFVFQVLLQSAPEKQIKETGGAHLVLFIDPFNVFKYRFSSRGGGMGCIFPHPIIFFPNPTPIKNDALHGMPRPPN